MNPFLIPFLTLEATSVMLSGSASKNEVGDEPMSEPEEPTPEPDAERETMICAFCQSPIPEDERGPEGQPIRLKDGNPVCLSDFMDIEELHRNS